MTQTQQDDADEFAELRKQAEDLITQTSPKVSNLSVEETQRLLHDLSVHQIELELQNEELKNTQLELETSRRKYIDLYEFSPVGLLVLDQDGRIHEPNLTLTRMLGISRPKLIKQELARYIDPASQDRYHFFFQQLRAAPLHPVQCEVILHPLNQAALTVRLEGIAISQLGNQAAYRVAVSDITAQKQLEHQTLELAAERHRIQVLSDFVRNLSQSVRTPLTSIVTGLYLVGKMPDKDAQLEKIDEIQRRVFDLNAVLDQLQHMAILDNLTVLDLEMGSLNRLIREVIQEFKAQAVVHKIKLTAELDELLPDLPLDITYMDRVLRNLIENALRFTPKNGLILLATSRNNESVSLEVSDTGAGIGEEALPHIFKRFYKGPVPGQTGSGAGLGLSIVQKIVELHKGTIAVSSTPGVKTVFTITLPLQ